MARKQGENKDIRMGFLFSPTTKRVTVDVPDLLYWLEENGFDKARELVNEKYKRVRKGYEDAGLFDPPTETYRHSFEVELDKPVKYSISRWDSWRGDFKKLLDKYK